MTIQIHSLCIQNVQYKTQTKRNEIIFLDSCEKKNEYLFIIIF